MNNTDTKFLITAKTCTLMNNLQEKGSIIIDGKTKYVIPIYQRPYSWGENEINKILSDIFISFWGRDEDLKTISEEPMFIGTMQLSTKKQSSQEQDIIDGQQRITTLLLFLKELKSRFPDCKVFETINFDLLRTEVNSGEQQKYLESVLQSDISDVEPQNVYQNNLNLIKVFLDKVLTDNGELFDINRFVNYLLSNIYFVVIETNAGLSKTLQIFNSINTTGLDLNGGDLFKIRMYEYLTNNMNEDKSVFEEISKLYQKIDKANSQLNWNANISTMLGIYQYIIVAKYKLPTTLYYLSVDTFFDRLFDTLLNINQWEHFKNNISNVELSLDDLDKIIELRINWEEKWRSKSNFSAEDICTVHLIWWSRYSRYWNLIFVFLFINDNNEKGWHNMLYLMRQLNKIFFIYSIRYQKMIGEIYYTLMQKIIESIIAGNFEETIEIIDTSIDNNKDSDDLRYYISENLTENSKRKNLVCRLSAMLDEDFNSNNIEEIESIEEKLFGSKTDIEHIQSYLDSNKEKRQDILVEWGDNINSIGNLMVLEQDINRSISNRNYAEKISESRERSYKTSKYKIVQNHFNLYTSWTLENCLERKRVETEKINKYLFNK